MKKSILAALFALAVAAPAAQAQLFGPGPTTPYYRQPYGPFGGYGGFGGPNLFGQGLVAPPAGIGGFRPIAPGQPGYPGGPTSIVPEQALAGRAPLTVDPNSANITGHPTRFMAYSQYFQNQGPGTQTIAPGRPTTTFFGAAGPQPAIAVGTRPTRGQDNTKMGGR